VVDDPIVIVGGGLAGARVADEYRAAGGEALVIMLSEDGRPPYHRPPLSKGVLRGEQSVDDALLRQIEEYDDLLVDLRLATTAIGVDTDAREVVVQGGERIGYGKLVIASGASPRTLEVPGADLPAVHAFRTLGDALQVRDEAEQARKAIVVGGSFIGSEVAASLRLRGLEVTIVEMGPRLAPALCSDELSEQLVDFYRDHGVEVLLNESLERFEANGRLLTGARMVSGEVIEAFLAVVGIGVEPNTAFLDGSGIAVDDGVLVDERLAASVSNVYAVGDVARFDDVVSGRPRRVEHWGNADRQGALLGRNLAGGRGSFGEVATFFTELFDLQLQVYGEPEAADDFVLRGSIGEGKLLGFHLVGDRLVGAVLAGYAGDVAEELKTLIAEKAILSDRARLADESHRPNAVFVAP